MKTNNNNNTNNTDNNITTKEGIDMAIEQIQELQNQISSDRKKLLDILYTINKILDDQEDKECRKMKCQIKVGHKVDDTFYTHLSTLNNNIELFIDTDEHSAIAHEVPDLAKFTICSNHKDMVTFWINRIDKVDFSIDCEMGYTKYNIGFVYSGFENGFCPLYYKLTFIDFESNKQFEDSINKMWIEVGDDGYRKTIVQHE